MLQSHAAKLQKNTGLHKSIFYLFVPPLISSVFPFVSFLHTWFRVDKHTHIFCLFAKKIVPLPPNRNLFSL